MSNYLYNSKTEADGLLKIEIWWLRKHNYLFGYKGGTIEWTDRWMERSRVGIIVSTPAEDGMPYVRLQYTLTDLVTAEKRDLDYRLRLDTTPCNFGGKRYWFVCSASIEGIPCLRRVGVLYKDGDYFACRHCYSLTYASRKINSRSSIYYSRKAIDKYEKAYELYKTLSRFYYAGRPTRKFQHVRTLAHRSGLAASLFESGVL